MGEVQRTFLDAVGEVIAADGIGLYRIDPKTKQMIDFRARVDVNFLDDYEDYGRPDDPVLDFVLREGRPIDSSRAVGARAWARSGARNALDIGGYQHSMEAPVVVSGLLFGTINFARLESSPGFSKVDLINARLISEHLGLAAERALRFEETGQRTTRLEHVLDRLPQAVVVTNLDAEVLFRNRAARSSGMASASAQEIVDGSISEAMASFRSQGKRVFAKSNWDAKAQRQVIVKSYRLPERDDAAVTLVFPCSRDDQTHLPAWNVLSKREQEIAALVSQGLTNKQIAERAFVSENTVKQHLKRVFNKTDVHNRAELMQRIWAAGAQPVDSDSNDERP
jgi:DNA-binding CsgD family transcriptional regulator/PAS domain-containing protein